LNSTDDIVQSEFQAAVGHTNYVSAKYDALFSGGDVTNPYSGATDSGLTQYNWSGILNKSATGGTSGILSFTAEEFETDLNSIISGTNYTSVSLIKSYENNILTLRGIKTSTLDLGVEGGCIIIEGSTGTTDGPAATIITQQDTSSASRYFVWTTDGADNTAKTMYTDSLATCYINPSTNAIGATYLDVSESVRHVGDLTTRMKFSTGQIELWTDGGHMMTIDETSVGINDTQPDWLLDVGGDIHATGDIISNSDIRLKTNIEPMDSVLEKIMKITPSTFDWIESGENDIGLIAQEVEKIFPELVKTGKKNGFKSISYQKLSVILLRAIQEMIKK
jgi:hypothetical protein